MFTAPSIDPVALHLGPLAIHWYGISYMVSIGLAYRYAQGLMQRYPTHLTLAHLRDYVSWFVAGILIGGRLGHVIFYDFAYYLDHPIDIFKVWRGGMAFHGALGGVIVATLAYSFHLARHIAQPITSAPTQSFWSLGCQLFWEIVDLMALVSPIGLGLGRVANFVNQELYGIPTNQPWGVIFPAVDNLPRHPAQLYEALWEGIGLLFIGRLILMTVRPKKKMNHRNSSVQSYVFHGQFGAVFLISYGLGRFIIEIFKEQKSFWSIGQHFFIPTTQGFCLLMTMAGFIILMRKLYRNTCKKNEGQA